MKSVDGKTFSAYVRSKLHSGYITASLHQGQPFCGGEHFLMTIPIEAKHVSLLTEK